jgi:hypothetical protein
MENLWEKSEIAEEELRALELDVIGKIVLASHPFRGHPGPP